jgi:hypothetical protein
MSLLSETLARQSAVPDGLYPYVRTLENDQLTPRLTATAIPIHGDSLQIPAILGLTLPAYTLAGDTIDSLATEYEATARRYFLRNIRAQVQVSGKVAQAVSDSRGVDLFRSQIDAKMLGMWSSVGSRVLYGTDVDPQPAGLITLADQNPNGLIDASGAASSLTTLDNMIELMSPVDGGSPLAFVMNSRQFKRMTSLACSLGCGFQFMPDPVLGRNLLHYMGIPLLRSDYILNTEEATSNRTSIYLVYLGARPQEPLLGGLVWFYKEDIGLPIQVSPPARSSDPIDVMYCDLELIHGLASLSKNAVLRTRNINGLP